MELMPANYKPLGQTFKSILQPQAHPKPEKKFYRAKLTPINQFLSGAG